MTPEQIHTSVKRQGAAERANCATATGIAAIHIDRWAADPREERMTEDDLDRLSAWVRGMYGQDQFGNWRRSNPPGPAKVLGVRAAPYAQAQTAYTPGENPTTGPRVVKEGHHERLPSLDDLKWQAAKRKEAEEEARLAAKRKAEKTGFPAALSIPLMTFGRKEATQ